VFVTLALLATGVAGAAESQWQVVGADQMGFTVVEDGSPLCKIGFMVHVPGFRGLALNGAATVEDGWRKFRTTMDCGKSFSWTEKPTFFGKLEVDYQARKAGENTLETSYTSSCDKEMRFSSPASKDVPSFWMGPVVNVDNPYFKGGTCRVETADGKTEEFSLPNRGDSHGVKSAEIRTPAG
jgi:hypothetical protein